MYPNYDLIMAVIDDRERRSRGLARSREAKLTKKEARKQSPRRRRMRLRDPLKA